jgi:hypothetical protein
MQKKIGSSLAALLRYQACKVLNHRAIILLVKTKLNRLKQALNNFKKEYDTHSYNKLVGEVARLKICYGCMALKMYELNEQNHHHSILSNYTFVLISINFKKDISFGSFLLARCFPSLAILLYCTSKRIASQYLM